MILSLNCGSQSVAWKLFEDEEEVAEGSVNNLKDEDYSEKLREELEVIGEKYKNINVVGHRVVHGGTEIKEPVLINEENLEKIEEFNSLAPLHNPKNVLGIKIAKEIFKEAKQVAVFDTEFYSDLPHFAKTYALPEELREKFQRFGFHGISHEYAAQKAAEEAGKNFNELKIISVHLGGGGSITAIKNGKAIDTSMGFTPLEGLIMMTRSGDIDPGIVLKIAKEVGIEKAEDILNKKSGMEGLCGSQNMLKVIEKAEEGGIIEKEALEIFVYRIRKYIGSYYVALGGLDLICFTGSIGNGHPKTREMILENLPFSESFDVVAIKPNEEEAIAKKAKMFL
jgi:acetate kinase